MSNFRFNIYVMLIFIMSSALNAQEYAIGADLSFLKDAEDNGFEFKEGGVVKPGFQIFEDHGYNWVRLRIFHSPTRLPNDLNYTLEMAKEAKKRGFKVLLDFHYSDDWADPAHQLAPKAWENMPDDVVVDSVFEYTRNTMIAFREADVFPDMVQVGNEISAGMIWPYGRLSENWDMFARLLQAGINGVYASCGNQPCPKVMVHIDKGGDKEFTRYFYDRVINHYKIDFDVIGQSYYPWWHGSLLDLRQCLNFAARTYKKDIIVVEAAYNYAPKEYVGKLAPFPESPEGQRAYLEAVNQIILNVPEDRGVGLFWWEPSAPGKGFETRTFFDKEGNVMPVIKVFDKYARK